MIPIVSMVWIPGDTMQAMLTLYRCGAGTSCHSLNSWLDTKCNAIMTKYEIVALRLVCWQLLL